MWEVVIGQDPLPEVTHLGLNQPQVWEHALIVDIYSSGHRVRSMFIEHVDFIFECSTAEVNAIWDAQLDWYEACSQVYCVVV